MKKTGKRKTACKQMLQVLLITYTQKLSSLRCDETRIHSLWLPYAATCKFNMLLKATHISHQIQLCPGHMFQGSKSNFALIAVFFELVLQIIIKSLFALTELELYNNCIVILYNMKRMDAIRSPIR